MQLYCVDFVRIAKRISSEQTGVLQLAENLGYYVPTAGDYTDSAVFSKRMPDLLQHFSYSPKPVTHVDRFIARLDDTTAPVTIAIVDPRDLIKRLGQSSLLDSFDQMVVVTLKENGKPFSLKTGTIVTKRKIDGEWLDWQVQKPYIIDREVCDIMPFNSTVQEVRQQIESDYELLKAHVAKNWTNHGWNSGTLTSALCVETKSDGKTLEWRIKPQYFKIMCGLHYYLNNPLFV
jgi:hypothetical protein